LEAYGSEGSAYQAQIPEEMVQIKKLKNPKKKLKLAEF